MRNCTVFLFFMLLSINMVLALKCVSNACDFVECPEVSECKPGEMKALGGHCLCCQLCKKIIGENEDCRSESLIAGPPSDKVICDKDLICHLGTCQKPENIYNGN